MARYFGKLYSRDFNSLFMGNFALPIAFLAIEAGIAKYIRSDFLLERTLSYLPLIFLFVDFTAILGRFIMYIHNYYLLCKESQETLKRGAFFVVLLWNLVICAIEVIIIVQSVKYYL